MPSDPSEFVPLIVFPELRDALPYAQALSEVGIEHRISEKFADFDPAFAGRRTMDQVKVEVAKADYEAALAAIDNVGQDSSMRVVKDQNDKDKKRGGSKGPWIISSAILLLTTLYFAQRTSDKELAQGVKDPLMYFKNTNNSVESYWKHNDELASEKFDEDQNGIFEKGELYDREGELRHVWLDKDQNGLVDEWRLFDRLGRRTTSVFDRNGNGRFEEMIEHRPDGEVKYIDANYDGYFDLEERVEAE